jgi:carbon-monoxide dehydrogenase large subunit
MGQRAGGPSAANPPAAAAAVDPAGEWSLVIRTPQGDTNARLSLRKEGDQIVGTLNSPQGTTDIRNVKLTGNELRFSSSVPIQSDTVEITVTGTIEGDTMRGVVVIPSLGSFEFTGTRPR